MNFAKCAVHANPSNGATGTSVVVTDTLETLVAAVSDSQSTTQARFVEVASVGPDACYLRIGGDAVASEGVPLYAGGMWSSPTPITAKVTAICASGETATLEVIPYRQI